MGSLHLSPYCLRRFQHLVSFVSCVASRGRSPADLLENVVTTDVLYVLVDDGACPLLLRKLSHQPLHNHLVVVPQISLGGGRGGGDEAILSLICSWTMQATNLKRDYGRA